MNLDDKTKSLASDVPAVLERAKMIRSASEIIEAVGNVGSNLISYPADNEVLGWFRWTISHVHIPYRVQSRLKDIGYAKEVLGGIVPTDDGLRRIAIDRERVLTFVEADALRWLPPLVRSCSGGCRCPRRSKTYPEGG
jgi:hypothetical protein